MTIYNPKSLSTYSDDRYLWNNYHWLPNFMRVARVRLIFLLPSGFQNCCQSIPCGSSTSYFRLLDEGTIECSFSVEYSGPSEISIRWNPKLITFIINFYKIPLRNVESNTNFKVISTIYKKYGIFGLVDFTTCGLWLELQLTWSFSVRWNSPHDDL